MWIARSDNGAHGKGAQQTQHAVSSLKPEGVKYLRYHNVVESVALLWRRHEAVGLTYRSVQRRPHRHLLRRRWLPLSCLTDSTYMVVCTFTPQMATAFTISARSHEQGFCKAFHQHSHSALQMMQIVSLVCRMVVPLSSTMTRKHLFSLEATDM